MYEIDIAQTWTPHQEFCWYAARRCVSDAIAALEEVGAALLSLTEDTRWQADGVRALNATMTTFSDGSAVGASALRTRIWELEVARE